MILLLLGVSIVSALWVFLLFTIIASIGLTRPYFVKIEEPSVLGIMRPSIGNTWTALPDG